MRGSVKWQVDQVFNTIKHIGQSKHEAKEIARESGARTWHEIGKSLGTHSFSTHDDYRAIARQCLNYCKEHFGVKDIEKLSGEHVAEFLNAKLEAGLAKSSLQTYAAALEKLEVALNKYSELKQRSTQYNFSEAIKEIREAVYQKYPDNNIQSRYIENAKELINKIENQTHQLAARLQAEGGARRGEIGADKYSQLTEKNLKGIKTDPHTGKEVGIVNVHGKGGKVRDIYVSPETYKQLEKYIEQHGQFKINYHAYRESLKSTFGEQYRGSHSLRWVYAQDRFQEVQEHGRHYEQALRDVSCDLGHNRPDITERYLR